MLDKKIISQIKEKINNEKILIFPTDTIYGILGKATSLEVVKKLQSLKGSDEKRSFLIIFFSINQIKNYLQLSEHFLDLISKFQDLSLTFIFEKDPKTKLISFNNKIAVRLISNDNKELRKIVAETGPLFATSCNYSGEPNIVETYKILEFAADNNLFLVNWNFKKDQNENKIASTILDCSCQIPKIIRIGKKYQQICERLDNLKIEYAKKK